MAQKNIVIISVAAEEDAHIPYVMKHLHGANVHLITPVELTQQGKLSYRWIDGAFVVHIDNKPLRNITSVWFRKPRSARDVTIPVPAPFQEYAANCIDYFRNILYNCFQEALWVSGYYEIVRADDKAWQITLARQLGFHVPETLITSSKHEAQAFLRKHKTLIVKPLRGLRHMQANGKWYTFFASKIQEGETITNLGLAPVILQTPVDAAYDIRVTVVGRTVFAAKISETPSESNVAFLRDWRLGYNQGETTFEKYNLPKDIADKCIAHVKSLGLKQGEIDLIRDKKGVYWFIENNPNGQWAFIEEDTGMPIGKAIADMLLAG